MNIRIGAVLVFLVIAPPATGEDHLDAVLRCGVFRMAIDVHDANVRQLLAPSGKSGFPRSLWDSYGKSVEAVEALSSLFNSPADDLVASIRATGEAHNELADQLSDLIGIGPDGDTTPGEDRIISYIIVSGSLVKLAFHEAVYRAACPDEQ